MSCEISFDALSALLINHNLLLDSSFGNDQNIIFRHITYDSRDIKPGTLFFCKGAAFKEEYLLSAAANGAAAYVSEQKYDVPEHIRFFIVSDIRTAMAGISALFYGYAYQKLNLTGITGTKGKTTVTYFLTNILNEHHDNSAAFISTMEIYTGQRLEKSRLSTPEALPLHGYFYEAAEYGMESFVMEVSSQAYKTGRVAGIEFDYGLFLNVSEDHISPTEHPDFEDYLTCKLMLMQHCKTAVINCGTAEFYRVRAAAKDAERTVTFGAEEYRDTADFWFDNVVQTGGGSSFILHGPDGYCRDFSITMQGLFNIENAVAAIVTAKCMGVPDESVAAAVRTTAVVGRMNTLEQDGITVIIDYAHNLLSFERLYDTIKQCYGGRRIVSLGGAVGGKSFNRRRDFADVVGRHSDYLYLTADDPQYESVTRICEEIASYINGTPEGVPSGIPFEIIEDRKTAIIKAFSTAKEGDVIVLLSKGADDTQKVNGKYEPYETDIEIAKKLLFLRGAGKPLELADIPITNV